MELGGKSLEIPLGVRFFIRSRLFTEAEEQDMMAVRDGETALANG